MADISGETNQINGSAGVETHAEVSHEHTLFAEPVFHIGDFSVTNSLLNSWLMLVIVAVIAVFLRLKISLVPGRIQSAFESVFEGFFGIFDSVTGSREKTLKFFPVVFVFFVFILINNWLGILPGVGSIGFIEEAHGKEVFVPMFRGGTADINTTLALALIGVVVSHMFGIFTIGFWNYFNKFVNLKALIEIPKKVFKDPSVLVVNPIKVFVGFIEIIGEAAKIVSLSLRLFGNIFAGEVLLASMAAIFAFGLPIPFLFLEIIVGLVQALIFAMLILIYLTIMTAKEEH
jgi:F-type H+-transporting ATPase subunit a